ncbi:MAG: AMIN domain-containing protein [Candidatus Marinarcus sp.]|uniref:AMIN domain-containing protein n=1 Tax=Candidatus Marinarcus sp. TaxID=3100987 RepID=UPI003AFF9DB4
MKLFSLLVTLFVIVTNNVNARENPFEPTKTYKDEMARVMEIEEDYPAEFQAKKDDSQYEKMTPVPVVEPVKEEVKAPVVKKEVVAKKEVVKKVPSEKVVYVPLRQKMYTKQAVISLLPGVELRFEGKDLEIKSKYEVFQKFDINDENKIILDFRATTSFYTVRKDLNSQYFSKIIIGNHQDENFFRIVLKLPASPKDYKVTYNEDLVNVVFEESGLK